MEDQKEAGESMSRGNGVCCWFPVCSEKQEIGSTVQEISMVTLSNIHGLVFFPSCLKLSKTKIGQQLTMGMQEWCCVYQGAHYKYE